MSPAWSSNCRPEAYLEACGDAPAACGWRNGRPISIGAVFRIFRDRTSPSPNASTTAGKQPVPLAPTCVCARISCARSRRSYHGLDMVTLDDLVRGNCGLMDLLANAPLPLSGSCFGAHGGHHDPRPAARPGRPPAKAPPTRRMPAWMVPPERLELPNPLLQIQLLYQLSYRGPPAANTGLATTRPKKRSGGLDGFPCPRKRHRVGETPTSGLHADRLSHRRRIARRPATGC